MLNKNEKSEPITKAARLIREKYNPSHIYLFGSAANETTGKYSDIDLCVVNKELKERPIELMRMIRRDIYPILKKPLDIIVYDEVPFFERIRAGSSFEKQIVEEGIEL